MQLPSTRTAPRHALSTTKDSPIPSVHPSSMEAANCAELNAIQRIVQSAFRSSRIQVQQIEMLENHVHQIRLLRLSDGSALVLKSSPRPTTKLLRHEKDALETEAKVLSTLGSHAGLPISRLIKFEARPDSSGPSFLLTAFMRGVPLREMQAFLRGDDRVQVDRQLGSLTRLIAQHTSPVFGTIGRVSAGAGTRSWRQAFMALVEAVLRDAEDMFISLPYHQIRQQMNRLTPILDEVTQARLVVTNLGDPSSVLLNPETRSVIGIVDLSSALWGDVLMAGKFQNPSAPFLEGYGSCLGTSGSERMRQVLYACHRAISAIVTNYYRNRNDALEIEARRALTTSLAYMVSAEY